MQQSSNDKKPGLSWSTPTQSNTASAPKQQPVKQQAPTTAPLMLPKMSTGSNTTARYAGIFVGGLIVGVVVAWGWSSLTHKGDSLATTKTQNTAAATNSTTDTKDTDTTKTTTNTTPAGSSVASGVTLPGSALTVASPQSAGQNVAIENVDVTKPTWVVVYDNVNGKPGNVLGAQLFFTSGSGTVTLLRQTVAGKSYLVGRSIDNGDRKFQKAGDTMVTDSAGNPVLSTFNAN